MTFWRQRLSPSILTSMRAVGTAATLTFISFNIWLLTLMSFHKTNEKKQQASYRSCVSFPYDAGFIARLKAT